MGKESKKRMEKGKNENKKKRKKGIINFTKVHVHRRSTRSKDIHR